MMNINYLIMIAVILVSGCERSDKDRYQGYVEGENIYLSSPYSGILIKKLVSRGQMVKQGNILFQLDDNPEAYFVAHNKAELEQAQKIMTDLQQPRRPAEIKAVQEQVNQVDAQLKLASLRVKRLQTLMLKGATDRYSLDAAIARHQELEQQKAQFLSNLDLANQGSRVNQVKAQQSSVDAALVELQQSQWQLAQKTLRAPADGEIFDTYYQQGEFVPAQHAIASLLPPDTLRIEFFVPMRVMNRLTIGQKVIFSCNDCTEEQVAIIRYISPEAQYVPPLVYSDANSDKLVFRIKARIESASTTFKPGQPVMVTIQYDKK